MNLMSVGGGRAILKCLMTKKAQNLNECIFLGKNFWKQKYQKKFKKTTIAVLLL